MEQWTVDPMSRQRTAMQIAAFLLDEAGERSLAEFLLCARPDVICPFCESRHDGVSGGRSERCGGHPTSPTCHKDAAEPQRAELTKGRRNG
jgi:hypothetical protein